MKKIMNILRGLGIVVAMSVALSCVAMAATPTTIKLPEETEDEEDDVVGDILKYHNVTLQEIKDILIAYEFNGNAKDFEVFYDTDAEIAFGFENCIFGWTENLVCDGWESFPDWGTEEGLEEMRATLTNPNDPYTVLTEEQVNALSDNDLAGVYTLWYSHELYDVLGY